MRNSIQKNVRNYGFGNGQAFDFDAVRIAVIGTTCALCRGITGMRVYIEACLGLTARGTERPRPAHLPVTRRSDHLLPKWCFSSRPMGSTDIRVQAIG